MLAASNLSYADVSKYKAAGMCYGLLMTGMDRENNFFDELPQPAKDNIRKYYPYSKKSEVCAGLQADLTAKKQCITNLNDENLLEFWDGFVNGRLVAKKYGVEIKIHTSTICSSLK